MAEKYRDTQGGRFFDNTVNEGEIDDSAFLQHPKQGSTGYIFGDFTCASNERGSVAERRQKQIIDEMEKVNQRTLEASKRTLGMVHESEQIGIITAEELLHQREQLENCETKVGDINRTLRTSQRHINSIKSIFGGFMNRFSKTSETSTDRKPLDYENTTTTGLSSTVETIKVQKPALHKTEHPALKLREVDYPTSQAARGNLFDEKYSTGAKVEDQLSENLDDLGRGLSRLKGLAAGLGQEIQEQNAIIDRLNAPVDKAEVAIQRQNKEMKKILHK